jgi:FdhE protein
VALNFLGKWFGARGASPAVEEVGAELDRLAAERPTFAGPVLWLRRMLPDLAPLSDVSLPVLEAAQARARLAAGVPLLRGERLTLDGKALRQRWQRACTALEEIQPEAATVDLAVAVKSGRLDLVALVEAVVAGRPEEARGQAEALGLDAGLASTLLRFAVFPHFTALAAKLAPLRQGAAWERGYCPTCGSWPLLGEFRGLDQSRFLRCGLCADGWEAARLWCPYCEDGDHDRLSFFHVEGEERKWRAAVCDGCRGYVKMIATLSALPPLALLVADAATLHLDLAAAERGCTNAPG